jgi:hypothetical protein
MSDEPKKHWFRLAKVFAGFQKYLYQRVFAQVAQASARVLGTGSV